jgi:phosphatidylethanolamine/phosphatidyl-N-methylethanolamine N-methyltransferase
MREVPSYESSYIQAYDTNNMDRTLAGSFLQKSHYLLEKTLPAQACYERIIEVGAGTGHHRPYVKHTFSQYVMTDGNDEMLEVASNKYSAELSKGTLLLEKQDATALTYPDDSFDRLIATHVLEHLPNPVKVLAEWNRVVRPGGVISIVLPCDPGMLWRLGRHFGPRRNAIRAGIVYDYMQAAEHVNSIFNLVVFLRHHFESIAEHWYPVRMAVPDLNLFYVCHLGVSGKQGVVND